ncbi:MAG TPA: GntR family transcriptional regulator, partial [Alphaproteobacteria bacterium]|nr:GntR family transcriptional regulator [Alphaproteobacteria bacterium]
MNENLTIALDPSSGISLQAQIRQSIVELILNHSILPGDKLPSSRMLSQQLKVSRNTVIFAYQALVDTGYLQPRERSGYVVSDDAPTTRLVDTPGAQKASDPPNHDAGDDAAIGKIDWDAKLVQSCSY